MDGREARFSIKKLIGGGLALALIIGLGVYGYSALNPSLISDYNEPRDKEEMLALFKRNIYWLSTNPNASLAFKLKYSTPDANPRYFGKMKTKVLRDHGKFVGFTSYYMETPQEGKILFVAVTEEFRGKRYADKLVHYAIKDLKSMGAHKILIGTRTCNTKACKIYERAGFHAVNIDEEIGFVYFEQDV
jgi:ribosomal protein S18 acetylase RimI-like enzyme